MRGYDRWYEEERIPPARRGASYDSAWMSEGAPWRRPPWWGDRFDPRYEGFNVPSRQQGWGNRGPSGGSSQRWPENQPSRYSQYGRRLQDAELESAVRRRMLEDTSLQSDAIEVQVEDCIVTLSGRVADYLEARYAWDDAWETEGVEGVISRIEVSGKDDDGSEGESPDEPSS